MEKSDSSDSCLLALVIIIVFYIIQKLWSSWKSSKGTDSYGNQYETVGGMQSDQNYQRTKNSLVTPIDDISNSSNKSYTREEKILRCKLAALYRVVERYGWTDIIYNHITVRVDSNKNEEHFLINPYGLFYNEITASSLIKVDIKGKIVGTGSTNLGVNAAGFTIHSAIHEARHDIACVVHHHHPSVAAISNLKRGFLPMLQDAAVIGEVSYHDYNGIVVDQAEKSRIVSDLGPTNKVMFMRNHGVVCCGATVEEAFMNTYLVARACEVQLMTMSMGLDEAIIMSDQAKKIAYEAVHLLGGVNSKNVGLGRNAEGKIAKEDRQPWRNGEQEFEALMRQMDNEGYRTGHIYKEPVIINNN